MFDLYNSRVEVRSVRLQQVRHILICYIGQDIQSNEDSAIFPVIRETDKMTGDTCSYQTVITIGFLTFTTVNYLTKYLVPSQASQTAQQKWKWRNVATSLVHSLITGLWAPICFYQVGQLVFRQSSDLTDNTTFQAPEMRDDLIRTFTYSSHVLVSFSIGYFLYDALDMMLYHRKRSTYELLLHHFSVVFCYSLAVTSQEFIAYGERRSAGYGVSFSLIHCFLQGLSA